MGRALNRKDLCGLALLFALAAPSFAQVAPPCADNHGANLAVNNAQVLHWESSTPNQFLARAHVTGQIVGLYPDHSGHKHFSIQIGPNSSDRLEVVYNQDFGNNVDPQIGDEVEACGDYITSTAQSGPYPPSPDGAIIHWVHSAPDPAKHPSGFLMINGVLYGQGPGNGATQGYQQPQSGKHHHGGGGN